MEKKARKPNPVYEFCWLLKMEWEAHPMNEGREYHITPRDLRAVKEFLAANFGNVPSQASVKARMDLFILDTFEGWTDADWPLWGFINHWNRYAPPRPPRSRGTSDKAVKIHCGRCGQIHFAAAECQEVKQ